MISESPTSIAVLKMLGVLLAAVFITAGCAAERPAQGAVTPVQAVAPVAEAPAAGAEAPPSWFSDGQPGHDARLALSVLADATAQGLDPQDYGVDGLARAFEQAEQGGLPLPVLETLDTALTTALQRYLSDLNNGRLSPEVLSHRFKAPPAQHFDAVTYLAQARAAGRVAEALHEAEPRVPMYGALRAVMNAYRVMGEHPAWQGTLPAPHERSVKPGQPYEGLHSVAARLAALGDLPADFPAGQGVFTIYAEPLVEGVKRFQRRHGLEPDGVIGPATLAELEVPPARRVRQMALTLERLRWTPTLYGPRMIAINVPEFMLRAYEQKGGAIELNLEMRVIVGRALNTETPIFLEDMRFIEFSPYWNVPPSIARGETLPRLRQEPDYFARQGFEFVTRDGSVVAQISDDAIAAVQAGQWRIRQRPGPGNALGDIKFIFPNDQNIYLHHTPAPQLFSRTRRDFSHGCIRIEQPVALAQFVLRNNPQWSTARIESAMSAGKSSTLRLDEPIPVLIAYSTAVVRQDGKVYFFPDIYKQDARLEQALNKMRPIPS